MIAKQETFRLKGPLLHLPIPDQREVLGESLPYPCLRRNCQDRRNRQESVHLRPTQCRPLWNLDMGNSFDNCVTFFLLCHRYLLIFAHFLPYFCSRDSMSLWPNCAEWGVLRNRENDKNEPLSGILTPRTCTFDRKIVSSRRNNIKK